MVGDLYSSKANHKRCAEKLALEHEVCVLRDNSKSHDKDVKELRAEGSRQSDHYNELFSAHRTSLEEVQMLRYQVIVHRSGIQMESVGGWLGVRTATTRDLYSAQGLDSSR